MEEIKSNVITSPHDLAKYFADALERNGWHKAIAGEDDFNAAVNALVRASESPIKKGVIVSGGYGVGKTSFVKAIPKGCFQIIDCAFRDEVAWLDIEDQSNIVQRFLTWDIVLDDLGAESLISAYGVKIDLVGEFITRYHKYGKKRLLITTNLSGEELATRYGGRVMSRLKDLCIPVRLTGKDKRAWNL